MLYLLWVVEFTLGFIGCRTVSRVVFGSRFSVVINVSFIVVQAVILTIGVWLYFVAVAAGVV